MKREYSAFIELLTHRPFTLDKSCSHSHLNRESESERQGSNRTSRQRQRRERKHKISNKRQSETDITSGYFTECSEPENLAVGFSAEGQWLFLFVQENSRRTDLFACVVVLKTVSLITDRPHYQLALIADPEVPIKAPSICVLSSCIGLVCWRSAGLSWEQPFSTSKSGKIRMKEML